MFDGNGHTVSHLTIAGHSFLGLFGVLKEDAGIALRGVFIIGPEGNIRYQLVHDLGIGRNVDEIIRVLQAIQYVDKAGGKEVCPANWKPGSETISPK